MRHAIYFAPMPGTLFHTLGSRWLGRDAFTGETLEQPDLAGIGVVTGDPRRYGFHATLKPPFALRDTLAPEALLRAVTNATPDPIFAKDPEGRWTFANMAALHLTDHAADLTGNIAT